MNLPMIGTAEKTGLSRYQVMLTDERDKSIHPMNRPKVNSFFENEIDRNDFVNFLELELIKSGCKIVKYLEHYCFVTFGIIDPQGNKDYSLTVYR